MSGAMVGISRSITVLFMALLVPVGCAPAGDWSGKWRGRREIAAPPGSDPSVAETLAAVKLEIKSDGSFVLTEAGFGFEGTTALGAKTGTLHVTRMLDRNLGTVGDSTSGVQTERHLTMVDKDTMLIEQVGETGIELKREPKE